MRYFVHNGERPMTDYSLAEIQETFELLGDWEERYAYLIDLGRNLPTMPQELKTEETKVKGCTSQVWMVPKVEAGRYSFLADSDALIVKGLIGVLLAAYNDKTPEEIGAVDIESAFQEMGLEQHLSPNRRNGFYAMVERIRGFASS